MTKREFILIAFIIFLMSGCSRKVTVDYSSFQKNGYRYVEGLSRTQKYDFDPIIRLCADKYNIDKKLIKAIIKKESDFNPNVINPYSGATGLMQIKPEAAGADVYKRILNRFGQPSRSDLKDPALNIEVGTAYITLLAQYLAGIQNPTSLEFCIISSYNSGAGAVLEVFSYDRKKAVEVINSMSSAEVYETLTTEHPRAEARDYLKKVLAYKEILSI